MTAAEAKQISDAAPCNLADIAALIDARALAGFAYVYCARELTVAEQATLRAVGYDVHGSRVSWNAPKPVDPAWSDSLAQVKDATGKV